MRPAQSQASKHAPGYFLGEQFRARNRCIESVQGQRLPAEAPLSKASHLPARQWHAFSSCSNYQPGSIRMNPCNTIQSLFSRRTVILFLIAWSHDLHAGPIPKLFNSGVDDSRALLANGQVDPHYRITASADPNFPGPDAFALLPGFPVGPWINHR